MALMNAIYFTAGAALSIVPMLPGLFAPPPEDKSDLNKIRIGVGNTNLTLLGEKALDGGFIPTVTLYDGNGELTNHSDNLLGTKAVRNGEFAEVLVHGLRTPEYIRLTAVSNDPVCVSWVSVTAASGDLRHWNGGLGRKCDVPWYPSSALLPQTNIRPPCVWLGTDANVPSRWGVTWRLVDFAPPKEQVPGTGQAKADSLGNQFTSDPDTLCRAPGRMQFWLRSGYQDCVPFYNPLLEFTAQGTDLDRERVLHGHVQRCGEAWTDNDTPLYDMDGNLIGKPGIVTPEEGAPAPTPEDIQDLKNSGHEFYDTWILNPIGKRRDGMQFVKARSEELEKCKHEIVLHDHDNVSARDMCESSSSWGPDMASEKERVYCDMCEHELYDFCETKDQIHCWDNDKLQLRVPAHRKRSDGSSYPENKVFAHIHEWS